MNGNWYRQIELCRKNQRNQAFSTDFVENAANIGGNAKCQAAFTFLKQAY